ncbi:hypothetical protein [Pseudothermotoga thermarum]|uniref:hypothetical protein n=1 Tax=Pseudothermotoga thermarum TaxID=119394 RepID=UPI000312B7E9|nr:hypothetical protein [Pseudothermotoga thermarum]
MKTIIIISHRLSTIKKATRIIVLDQGRIVCEDTHENLLKNCGVYKKVMQRQLID